MENNKTIQVDIDLLKKIQQNLYLGTADANMAFAHFCLLDIKQGSVYATSSNDVLDDIIKDIELLVGENNNNLK